MLRFNDEMINKDYSNVFKKHQEITSDMRLILLDWMCQVCADYYLKRQTFHRSLNMVDQVLMASQNIKAEDFQLLGVTCLHIAAKVEEIYPPHIAHFVESTQDSVTIEQILATETRVCK